MQICGTRREGGGGGGGGAIQFYKTWISRNDVNALCTSNLEHSVRTMSIKFHNLRCKELNRGRNLRRYALIRSKYWYPDKIATILQKLFFN